MWYRHVGGPDPGSGDAAGSGYESARQMASEGIGKAQENFKRTQAAASGTAKDSAAQAAADTKDATADHVRACVTSAVRQDAE